MKWRSKQAAQEAIETSSKQLKAVKSQEREVAQIVERLTVEGQRNHFAERLQMHYARGNQ